MQESMGVREAMLRFYDRFSAGDVAGFAQLITAWEDAFVIGTDPGEWQDGRATWIAGYEDQIRYVPGIRLETGDLRGYAEGTLGWAADQPTFVIPDGTTIPTRLTAVLHQEDGEWKLVNAHFSVGVPNEELFDLVKRWSSEPRVQGI
jgi:ketosteroid isomerase-like protein